MTERITVRVVGNVVLVSGPGDLPREARMFPRDTWAAFLREVRAGTRDGDGVDWPVEDAS